MNNKTNNDVPWWIYLGAISLGITCMFGELFNSGSSSKPSWEVEYDRLKAEQREEAAQREILRKKFELLENNKTW